MSKCNKKIKYNNFKEANKVKNSIIKDHIFSTLNTYWCEKHMCVHLGHSNRMDNKTVIDRQFQLTNKKSWIDNIVATERI